MTLDEALKDTKFLKWLDNLDFAYCYDYLSSSEDIEDLYRLLLEEEVNPFSNMATIPSQMFYHTKIDKLYIPENIKHIEESVFDWCNYLKEVEFAKNSELISIGAYSFFGCGSLKEIKLPDSVEIIGMGAFKDCSNLETVYIGSNIRKIRLSAFENCINLENIVFNGSKDDWDYLDKTNGWRTGTHSFKGVEFLK